MTATSQKDGSFSFEKVPYGNWLVREIEQPKGFVLDDTFYEVKISEVGQVIEVEIVNEYTPILSSSTVSDSRNIRQPSTKQFAVLFVTVTMSSC